MEKSIMKKYIVIASILVTFIFSTIILSPPKPLRSWGGIALAAPNNCAEGCHGCMRPAQNNGDYIHINPPDYIIPPGEFSNITVIELKRVED